MGRKILARGWTFEINTGTDAAPNWVTVGGLTDHSWDSTKTDVDDTDYDSGGWEEHRVASRGLSCEMEGNYIEETDGSRDPGQEAVEQLAQAVGDASLAGFRVTSPGGRVVSGKASADTPPSDGGGNDDNTGWSATMTFSGQPAFA